MEATKMQGFHGMRTVRSSWPLFLLLVLVTLVTACLRPGPGTQATPIGVKGVPVPEYPGATVVSQRGGEVGDAWHLEKVYVATATPEDVIRFYRDELPKQGWRDRKLGRGMLNYDIFYPDPPQEYHLYVNVSSNDGESSISIEIEYIPEM